MRACEGQTLELIVFFQLSIPDTRTSAGLAHLGPLQLRELQDVRGKPTRRPIDPLVSPAFGRLSASNWLNPPPPLSPPPPRSVRHTVQDARRLVHCCCCCCCCVLLLLNLNKPKTFRLSASHRIGERRSRRTSSSAAPSNAIYLYPRMSSRFGRRVPLRQRFPPPRMPRWETIYDRYPSSPSSTRRHGLRGSPARGTQVARESTARLLHDTGGEGGRLGIYKTFRRPAVVDIERPIGAFI